MKNKMIISGLLMAMVLTIGFASVSAYESAAAVPADSPLPETTTQTRPQPFRRYQNARPDQTETEPNGDLPQELELAPIDGTGTGPGLNRCDSCEPQLRRQLNCEPLDGQTDCPNAAGDCLLNGGQFGRRDGRPGRFGFGSDSDRSNGMTPPFGFGSSEPESGETPVRPERPERRNVTPQTETLQPDTDL